MKHSSSEYDPGHQSGINGGSSHIAVGGGRGGSGGGGGGNRISRSSRSGSLATVLSTTSSFPLSSSSSPTSSSLRNDQLSSPIPSYNTTGAPSSSSSSKAAGFQVLSRPQVYLPTTVVVGLDSRSTSPRPLPPPSVGALLTPHPSTSSTTSTSSRKRHNNDGSATTTTAGVFEPKTTLTLSSSIDPQGRRMVNQYVRLKTIGQGSHGKVWLCTEPSLKDFKEEEEDEELDDEERRGRRSKGKGRLDEDQADDDDDEEEVEVNYCAIKSVAREGVGRGKSLRQAKGRKGDKAMGIGNDHLVKREVAIMKRLDHRNVVRLKEVIDDVKSKKVFMVLEFMAGGQIVWQDEDKRPTMTVDEARRTFRDVVLGLEYLHYQGIIHRDIKPANLLWTEDHSLVKISDFGVSHVSDALDRATTGESDDDKALRKTAGSPAFFAPELCHPAEQTPTPDASDAGDYFHSSDHRSRRSSSSSSSASSSSHSPARPRLNAIFISLPLSSSTDLTLPRVRPIVGKSIDVWALGVTLYCLLFGDTPFLARTEYELYNVIVKESIAVPERMGREGAWTGAGEGWEGCGDGMEGREVVDLLGKLLEKDPTKRISLEQVKQHPWVLRNLSSPTVWLSDTNPARSDTVIVTEDDVNHATQTRGTVEILPIVRRGIRRALQAALQRFPIFSRKKDDEGDDDEHDEIDETRRQHSRSKSNSSISRSANTSEGGNGPSRQSSDAANSKRSMERQQAVLLANEASPVSITSSANGERRWRVRNGNAKNKNEGSKETGGQMTPSTTTAAAAALTTFKGSLSHHLMRPSASRTTSSPSRHRDQLSSDHHSVVPPPTRNSSPFQKSTVGPSDADSITTGKRLSRLLSKLGRWNGSKKNSASEAEAEEEDEPVAIIHSRQAMMISSSPLVLPPAAPIRSASNKSKSSRVRPDNDDEEEEDDGVDSTEFYSSDEEEDADFVLGPIARIDQGGWHSSLQYQPSSHVHRLSPPLPSALGMRRDDTPRGRDVYDDAFEAEQEEAGEEDEDEDAGVDVEEEDLTTVQRHHHGGGGGGKAWSNKSGRDGSIRNGVVGGGGMSNKWQVYTSDNHHHQHNMTTTTNGDEQGEEEDDQDDIFFETKRSKKKTQGVMMI